MQITRLLSLLSVVLFIRRTLSEAIAEGPFNTAADVGLWANFTCSVSCDHLINWFVEGYPSDISSSCSSTHNDLMVCKQTTHECGSSPSARNYTEVLRVLAKSEHAGSKIAVQCAAVSRSFESRNTCNPFITYSRFALLTVNNASGLPTPSPCNSTREPSTVTVTSTVTETRGQSTVTVTSISTSTVVVTASPPPLPAPNSVTDSRRQFGTMVTQLFMWSFTIAMGLMFARLAVHL